MRHKGRMTSWKDDRGFGFIAPNGGGQQVFVHIKSFANRQRRPAGDEVVTYELRTDAKGRAQAERVAFAGERLPSDASSGRSGIPLVLAGGFLVFVAGAVFAGQIADCRPWAVLHRQRRGICRLCARQVRRQE